VWCLLKQKCLGVVLTKTRILGFGAY